MKQAILVLAAISIWACHHPKELPITATSSTFIAIQENDEIKVYQSGSEVALVTQNAQETMRPYLHPIMSPHGKAALTQYSPGHHKHQTGLYWGFTRVNGSGATDEELKKWFYNRDKPAQIQEKIGRDFFHNNGEGYWQKLSSEVLIEEGEEVKWQTVYHMLDEHANPILEETQTWTFKSKEGKNFLSLEWSGKALMDITVNKFSYGGLFLRMPWHKGIKGSAVNAARQINEKANGQQAMWLDVGMEIEGLDQEGHIVILDHPDNDGFPTKWRVDGQLGVGPVHAASGDWHIKEGEVSTFRHQLIAYEGAHDDVMINDLWADYVGDHGMYNTAVLWGIAQKEARNAKLLSPQEAVDAATIKEGYEVNAFASEPMITQPMAFCWDDKGRMWIAENRDYESRGHGFSNSGDSRILILEDTDHDGVADKRTVFLENIPFPSAIAVGFDGVFIGAPPNLLFVPDRNHDDKADVDDIEIKLTGWGIRDRHETLNSFLWGPDGWLYGLEGFATPSVIRKPVGTGKIYRKGEDFPADLLEADGIDVNGGVWRYHPTKDRFEVVAHGFSNPWGVDYDAKGQMFISACVIPHLFHVVQGGIYQRQGGTHFNPYVYQDIQTIVDHRHRSAHGGARIYQSDAFPEEERGKIFMANIHEHAVLSDELRRSGSGFIASHGDDFMLANNAQWIGFSMEIGPEGGLYVLDWHDADICGNEVVNKETGRVFRIMPKKTNAEQWEGRYDDLNKLSDLALVELQYSPSNWHERRARIILQNRADKGTIDQEAVQRLNDILSNEKNHDSRLKALWTLHSCGLIDNPSLITLLQDSDQYIRSWAIQFLTEDKDVDQGVINALTTTSEQYHDEVTKLYLAAALQRIPANTRWNIAENLISEKMDASDPNIPYMVWFGIEPIVTSDPDRALSIAMSSALPSISSNITRRLIDDNKIDIVISSLNNKSKATKAMLQGILAGVQGRTDIAQPSEWNSIKSQLSKNQDIATLLNDISQQFGNQENAARMIAVLNNGDASIDDMKGAIKSLATHQRAELAAKIPELLNNSLLRTEVIRSVAAFDDKKLGQKLLELYPSLNYNDQQEVIQTMASRSNYGWQLAYALKDEKISKKDIPAYIALQLRRVVGNGFVEIWGPIDEITGDKKSEILKYQRIIHDEAVAAADLDNGLQIFQRTCSVCHQMHGSGGKVGPDLTGSNRTNTAYLLSNIIDPSGDLQDDYKLVVVTTQDGRTHTGNIKSENERTITLRTVALENVIINKTDIQSKDVSPKSMMPEGLLKNLSEQEIINLVAYMKRAAA